MTARGGPTDLPDEISAAYIGWCIAENVPANTISRRRSVLRGVGNAGVATREEIEEWWAGRRDLKDSTRSNDLAVIRSFYRWCQVWEHRYDDPSIRLPSPRPETGAPKPVSLKEFNRIRAHVETMGVPGRPLLRAVNLAAGAGLRCEEAARLNWDDVDIDARQARVLGKGRKVRVVSLNKALLEQLADGVATDPGVNVVTGVLRAWTPDTLGRKVNAAIAAAGVNGTFHKLRHRYGSVAYQRTKDPKAVADQMGHASVATTLKFYAAAADDAAAAIADAVVEDW